ncbi:MAG: AraC family transcriptional regulator [Brevinema sp.]
MSTDLEKLEQSSNILREKIKVLLPKSEVKKIEILGFSIIRHDKTPDNALRILKPMAITILDGYRHFITGSEKLVYGRNQTLVTGIDIICSSSFEEASPEKPDLAVIIELDHTIIGDLIREVDFPKIEDSVQRSMAVAQSETDVLDAYSRLIDLFALPEAKRKILAPMLIREIHFLLLSGPLGNQIRMIHTNGCTSNRIAQAATWIRDHFSESFKVEDIAAQVFMAPSSFYRNFSKVTGVSPIQYQKQFRLCEARRLILEGEDAVSAAYQVGYESPSQFHKEYKRMFGSPPKVDVKKLMPTEY